MARQELPVTKLSTTLAWQFLTSSERGKLEALSTVEATEAQFTLAEAVEANPSLLEPLPHIDIEPEEDFDSQTDAASSPETSKGKKRARKEIVTFSKRSREAADWDEEDETIVTVREDLIAAENAESDHNHDDADKAEIMLSEENSVSVYVASVESNPDLCRVSDMNFEPVSEKGVDQEVFEQNLEAAPSVEEKSGEVQYAEDNILDSPDDDAVDFSGETSILAEQSEQVADTPETTNELRDEAEKNFLGQALLFQETVFSKKPDPLFMATLDVATIEELFAEGSRQKLRR